MTDFPYIVDYRDQAHFVVTPSPLFAEFTGSVLTMAKIDKGAAYEYQTNDQTVLPDYLEKSGGTTQQINQYGNSKLVCAWDVVTAENYSEYIPAFAFNFATIVNGFASVAFGQVSVSDPIYQNDKDFTVEFKARLDVSLNNTENEYFSMQQGNTRYFKILTDDQNIKVDLKTDDGSIFTATHTLPDGATGTEYDIAATMIGKQGNNDGVIYLYVDGLPVATVPVTDTINTGFFTDMFFKSQNRMSFKNFRYEATDKYGGNAYVPVETLPTSLYLGGEFDLIDETYNSIGEIQAFLSLNETNVQNMAFKLDDLYWNGFAWVVSNNQFESNTITEINANAHLFPQTDSVKLTGVFFAGILQGKIDAISYVVAAQGYAHSLMAVSIQPSIPPASFVSANAVLTEPTENTLVTFALSKSGQLYFYDAQTDQFEFSNGTYLETNTLAELNANIHKFEAAGLWFAHVFLTSLNNPETGLQDLEAPSISFLEIVGNVEANQAPPPFQGLIYFFSRTPCGDIGSSPIVLRNERIFMHGNYKIDATYDCTLTPENVVGLAAKSIIETASINELATSVSEKYMYAMIQIETVKTKVGSKTVTQKVENFLGYVEIPMQGNITLDQLWDERIFERPANGIQTDEALQQAQENYPLPPTI